MDEATEYDHSADPFSMSLYSISAGQHGIEVPIELNNQSVLMELDTGAGISIISEETHAKYFKGIPLERSTTKLHAYTGDPIHVLGQFNVSARYKSQSQPFPSLLLLVLDPHFWEEIGSLKFVWIGTKSSVYMLMSLQFRP